MTVLYLVLSCGVIGARSCRRLWFRPADWDSRLSSLFSGTEPTGGPVKGEEDALDPNPPAAMRESLRAIEHLERAVRDAPLEGIALRYGSLYGPGTSEPIFVELAHKRRLPVVGDGGGIWSFVHVEDAAAATAIAVERGPPGVYNIVDDNPAPSAEWIPALAERCGAKPPRHLPRWLGRLAAGEVGVSMMCEIRGASNAKAKRELGWQPTHPTWRGVLGAVGTDRADTPAA